MKAWALASALALMAGGAEAAVYRYDYVGNPIVPGDPTTFVTGSLTVDLGKVVDVDSSGFIAYNIQTNEAAPSTIMADGLPYALDSGVLSLTFEGIDLLDTPELGYAFFEITPSGDLLQAEIVLRVTGAPTTYRETTSYYSADGTLLGGVDFYSYLVGDEYVTYSALPALWTRTVIEADPPVSPVPLPASAAGLMLAFLGLAGLRRRA